MPPTTAAAASLVYASRQEYDDLAANAATQQRATNGSATRWRRKEGAEESHRRSRCSKGRLCVRQLLEGRERARESGEGRAPAVAAVSR